MTFLLIAAATFASAVTATWHTNLNYGSPSRRHVSLGIDVPKVVKRGLEPHAWDPAQLNFTHGVASGDPLPDSVILWTRISPALKNDASNVTVEGNVPLYNHDTETYIKASPNPICVDYQVGSDKNFSRTVDKGTAYTTSDIDYTVKVEAKNLEPFTQYYYQFSVCGSSKKSPIGRTKTSPNADDDTSKIGIAGNAARKDKVDYVIHLGDYIYETGKSTLGKDPRATDPKGTIFTLYDYRTRIAQYRTDLDLLSHQQYPWIPVWDDHEVSNNGYRDGSSGLNNTENSFNTDGGVSVDQRKMNAVRISNGCLDIDDNLRIWRTFQVGKLIDLIMLDTRNYDRSITTLGWNDEYVDELKDDAGGSLTGSHQENWFCRQLTESAERGATWRIIGNQIVFSRINDTARSSDWLNADQWDGYTANRNRTLSHLYSNKIFNNVFLSGDSHANWVSDLVWLDETPYDQTTGDGSIGVEFAGTAVSSTGFGGTIASANQKCAGLVKDNRELQWNEEYYRGYFELHSSPSEITANYYDCPTVATRNPFEISLANFTVKPGANYLQRNVANGTVETGALQRGNVGQTNLTLNTEMRGWTLTAFDQMFISTKARRSWAEARWVELYKLAAHT